MTRSTANLRMGAVLVHFLFSFARNLKLSRHVSLREIYLDLLIFHLDTRVICKIPDSVAQEMVVS